MGDAYIYARAAQDVNQFTVCQIDLHNSKGVVLPIPIETELGPAEFRFIDIEDVNFFWMLENLFPRPFNWRRPFDFLLDPFMSSPHKIKAAGHFVGVFAKTLAELSCLGTDFYLPDSALEKLAPYGDFSFVAFQPESGAQEFPPIAFEFARRESATLYFPTLIIVDDKGCSAIKHAEVIYCQQASRPDNDWVESKLPLRAHPLIRDAVECSTGGVLAFDRPVYRRKISGVSCTKDA